MGRWFPWVRAACLGAALLACGMLNVAISAPHPKKSPKSKVLKHRLSSIRSRKLQARAELRVTRAEAHGVKLDIVSVDSKLEKTRNRLEQIGVDLKDAKTHLDLVSNQLAKATRQLSETKKLVEVRIRTIYIQGNASSLSALAGVKSSGEIASQRALMESIERKDRDIFNRYVHLQQEVAIKKREANGRVSEVRNLEESQNAQARSFAADRGEKARLLGRLQAKQQDLQEMISQFEQDEAQIGRQIEAYERAMAAASHRRGTKTIAKFAGRFQRPVEAPITSTFGMRFHPILHRVRMHTGIDFGAAYGSQIHAAASGVVIFSSFMNGYGHVVVISHGGGYSTVYAHASKVFVHDGEGVHAGQTIAAVGASGLATGPHLHFELRLNGKPVDPLGRL